MTTAYDVPAEPLIRTAASKLKEVNTIKPPEWAAFVRTGAHTERPPEEADWWHIRAAAVLRKVYLNGPIGTERLAALFGGKRDFGVGPYHAVKGSRKVTRTILQQLQEAGLVSGQAGKGRTISAEGRKFLDAAAHEVRKTVEETVPALSRY